MKKTIDIIVGIDGTGNSDQSSYSSEFINGFVKRLTRDAKFDASYYLRGPTLSGGETGALGEQAFSFLVQLLSGLAKVKNSDLTPKIYLTGYSRGAAAAIHAARLLVGRGIAVHGLFLFDAVDVTSTIANTTIPTNVSYCAHAMRSHFSKSRNYTMSNCGLECVFGTKMYKQWFMTTHGGMGGVPWGKKFERDGFICENAQVHKRNDHMFNKWINREVNSKDMHGEYYITSVSAAQEAMGCLQVWQWMLGMVSQIRNMPIKLAKPDTQYGGLISTPSYGTQPTSPPVQKVDPEMTRIIQIMLQRVLAGK